MWYVRDMRGEGHEATVSSLRLVPARKPFCCGVLAQQSSRKTIGVLVLGNPDPAPFIRGLREELRDLGYREGQDIQFEVHSAGGKAVELAVQASQLVARKVDVIVAFQTPAATAAKRVTTEIPIVMEVADPVETGLIASLDTRAAI